MGRLGVNSVVLMGEGEDVDKALRKMKSGIGVGRTIVRIGAGRGEWVRGRIELVGKMGSEKAGVWVCEMGACREGIEYV